MKKWYHSAVALLLCLLLLCGGMPWCVSAASDNLLKNGDGEVGNLTGWTPYQSTAISNSAAHNGSYGIQLKGNGSWGALLEQKVNLAVGKEYRLEFWYKVNSNGANWKLVKEDGTNYNANWVQATAWTKVTCDFTAVDKTVVLNFSGGGNGKAEDVYVDDLRITELQPAVAGELVNGSFENGDEGWLLSGQCAVVSGDAYSGTHAVRLEHNQTWAEALTQTLSVEKNTDYVITFYTKRVSGNGAWNLCLMDGKKQYQHKFTSGENWFKHTTTNNWVKGSVGFNSGNYDSLFIKFQPESTASGVFLLDFVTLTKKTEDPVFPDDPVVPKAQPYMTSYGVAQNRPASAAKNLLKGADFESGTFGFKHSSITSVTDKTAPQGKKSLYFKTGTSTVVKEIVWVDVKPNTDYVFSTWLKGAYISKDNPLYNATVGIVDESGTFLSMEEWVFLNGERQIVPTAWDNAWHLRSIQFHSADATRVGICLSGSGSQLWLDDMALFKVGDGTKYMSANMLGAVGLNYEDVTAVCADKHNLISDGSFESADTDGFWADSHGWRNGFLTFAENAYEYGTSLKYTASGRDSALSIIKWVDVEPNTDYTFSLNMRILKSGNGRLLLLDDKNRDKTEFLYVSFDRSMYSVEDAEYGWYSLSCSFNTDVYSRIGICVVDDGGEVLLDNMRLFKNTHADPSVKDAFAPSPEAPNPEDYPDGEDDPVVTPTDPSEPYVPFDPLNPNPTTSVAEDTSSADEETGATPKPRNNLWLWLTVAGAVVLVAAAVVVVLWIRKKKQSVE